jgi:hypothetical protein
VFIAHCHGSPRRGKGKERERIVPVAWFYIVLRHKWSSYTLTKNLDINQEISAEISPTLILDKV